MTILTVSELRDFVTSELEDSALQVLLDSTEEAIIARAGAPGTRTEITGGGGRLISLARPVSAITSITETVYSTTTTLQANDYLIHPDGYLLERLNTGTNPHWHWHGRVTVVYVPVADTALRKEVQIALLKLALSHNPGLTSETIGTWTEQYANNSAWNNDEERESILSRLDTSVGILVV